MIHVTRVLLVAIAIVTLTELSMAALSGYHGNWSAAVWYGVVGVNGALFTTALIVQHHMLRQPPQIADRYPAPVWDAEEGWVQPAASKHRSPR